MPDSGLNIGGDNLQLMFDLKLSLGQPGGEHEDVQGKDTEPRLLWGRGPALEKALGHGYLKRVQRSACPELKITFVLQYPKRLKACGY